ncbi:MAG: ABC transporter ATP-binding protein [Deltaproteobacteria bacterium]|nr:ABC transporter ATP-binding protein [Deltaproteobacteria bacterium]
MYPGGEREPGAHAALTGLSLTVRKGEVIAVVGPSGCGKSTTLRLVAGLDEPDQGTIHLAGRPMKGIPPQDRDVAMVFQGYALYPQMTAREIMEFPLRMRKAPPAERARAVDEAASLLGLSRLLGRRPDQLSGGERQRVAMGRAIVRKPRVFLFDEPLSNVDPSLREELRQELGSLVRGIGATALYVTHDHAEALSLGDRVAVLRAGRLLQCDTPRALYETPSTEFVGAFVGSPRMNLLDGERDGDSVSVGPFRVSRGAASVPHRVRVGVRPEDVTVSDDGVGVEGTLVQVEPIGAETHLVVEARGLTLRARRAGFDLRRRGQAVRVSLVPGRAHFFDPSRDGARCI